MTPDLMSTEKKKKMMRFAARPSTRNSSFFWVGKRDKKFLIKKKKRKQEIELKYSLYSFYDLLRDMADIVHMSQISFSLIPSKCC